MTEMLTANSHSPVESVHALGNNYAEPHDRSLLIVDDEENLRNLFSAYLGATYECETAADAQEALKKLASQSFALVLTDMQMPGLGGIELVRKIVERYPDTATIVVSVIDRTQRVIDALRVGAFDYLMKPCDLDVLSFSVERALERRALLRNARQYRRDLEKQNAELAEQQTQMTRLQEHIVQSEKIASLALMAARVARELNNPADFICSNVDTLRVYLERLERCLFAYDQLNLSPEVAARIARLKASIEYDHIIADLRSIMSDCCLGAERIRDVAQDLRLFSRLHETEVQQVDIREGIEAAVRLLTR